MLLVLKVPGRVLASDVWLFFLPQRTFRTRSRTWRRPMKALDLNCQQLNVRSGLWGRRMRGWDEDSADEISRAWNRKTWLSGNRWAWRDDSLAAWVHFGSEGQSECQLHLHSHLPLLIQLDHLTEEHARIMVHGDPSQGHDPGYLHQEIGHLREDLRLLRDKNHQLVQDNIKLTEHLRDVDRRKGFYRGQGRSRDAGQAGHYTLNVFIYYSLSRCQSTLARHSDWLGKDKVGDLYAWVLLWKYFRDSPFRATSGSAEVRNCFYNCLLAHLFGEMNNCLCRVFFMQLPPADVPFRWQVQTWRGALPARF